MIKHATQIILITLATAFFSPVIHPASHAAHAQDRLAIYHARKFGIGAEYQVHIRYHTPAQTSLGWMALPDALLAPSQAFAAATPWVQISLTHRILGSVTRTDSLLQPDNGRAIQRIVRREQREYTNFKVSHFGNEGIHVLRLRSGADLAELDWNYATSRYEPYPLWFGEPGRLTDVSALFFLLSNDALQVPGGQLQMPVFTDGQLMQLELQAHEYVAVGTRYA